MRSLLVSAALAALLAAAPVAAQSPTAEDAAKTVFDAATKRVIKDWYEDAPGASRDDTKEAKADEGRGKGRGEGRGKGRGDAKAAAKDKGPGKEARGGLPPGLAKRDQLPPGLAKRGNRLPHGLAKRDLPPDLEARLGPLPEGAERIVVDDDVLLVETATNVILDVLEGVARGGGGE